MHHQLQLNVQILDIRARSEYEEESILGARHIHLGSLADHYNEIPNDKKLVLHCTSGDRSNIGCSILRSKGFTNVANLAGGIDAWKAAGFDVEHKSLKRSS